jgi:hypothetical protein
MKKILFFTALLWAMATFIGCDEMLDVTPQTDFSDVDFWKTEAHLKGACNRLYEQLAFASHDTRGDDQVGKSPNGTSAGSWSIPAESSDWSDPYKRIFTANNIIEKGAEAPIDEAVRDKYIAEARFFRAYYYFDLVSKYGDVPLVLKVFTSTSDPDLKMARTPREQVIQQCYADLAFAADHLPKASALATTEFDRRRVSRSSALGLQVRIGLHEGTMQKYHQLGSETQWKAHLQKSIDAYNLLKTDGWHTLYATGGTGVSYQALFFDESNTSNKEILFAKAYGNGSGGTGSGTGYTNHSYSGDCEGSYALTRKMIDLYLYDDGLPRSKTTKKIAPETSFNDVLESRDPRLQMSVWRIGDPQDVTAGNVAGVVGGVNIGWINSGKNAYISFDAQRVYGYHQKKSFAGSRWGAAMDYTDRIIIRWGEMLISYAEALYELNGSITDGQLDETVNALRDRVGFNVKLSASFVSANGLDIKEEIRRERTVELMAENRRYADLIRWKIAETELPQAILGGKFTSEANNYSSLNADSEFLGWLTDATGKIGGVQVYENEENIRMIERASDRRFSAGKDYYYPIPVFDIAQSGGVIKQNPSWE